MQAQAGRADRHIRFRRAPRPANAAHGVYEIDRVLVTDDDSIALFAGALAAVLQPGSGAQGGGGADDTAAHVRTLLTGVVRAQNDRDAPQDKRVTGDLSTLYFTLVYNLVVCLPPRSGEDYAYVDGENFFNDARAGPAASFADMCDRLSRPLSTGALAHRAVVFVKHTSTPARQDHGLLRSRGHTLINVCRMFPAEVCLQRGRPVNREIDDVVLLTCALYYRRKNGAAAATVVSNDRYRFLEPAVRDELELACFPDMCNHGGGGRSAPAAPVCLAAVTFVCACVPR